MNKSKKYISGLLIIVMALSIFSLPVFNEEVNADGDTTAPKVTNVTFPETVVRPGIMQVDISITEEGTGISTLGVSFDAPGKPTLSFYILYQGGTGYGYWDLQGQNSDWVGTSLVNLGNSINPYSGTISLPCPINSNWPLAEYTLSTVHVSDNSGNAAYYSGGGDYLQGPTNSINSGKVTIKDEFEIGVETGLGNPNLVKLISDMPDGKAAKILMASNQSTILPKGAFDAIKGKDKTIVAYKNGLQWIFQGKDIVNVTKDIDLTVDINMADGNLYGLSENIVSVKFPNNGLLPGKAKVRFKSDYLYNLNQIKGNLYLFYLDENNNEIRRENTDFDLVFDGTDKWCHFDVTHNSQYIISANSKLKNPYVKPSKLAKPKAKAGKKKLTVSWKKNSVATGYQIKYSTSKKFKNNKKITKTITIKNQKTVKKTIKKLKSKKNYYIKVRAYNKNAKGVTQYGKWSKVKKIKTK